MRTAAPGRRRHEYLGPDDWAPLFCGTLTGLTVGYVIWQLILLT